MSYHVIPLPTVTVSSGGTNSTGVDVSDAYAVWFALNSTTTAGTNTLTVQGSLSTKGTSDTGATFFDLGLDSTGAAWVLSSGTSRTVSPIGVRMVRVTATAAVGASSGYSVQMAKLMPVVV